MGGGSLSLKSNDIGTVSTIDCANKICTKVQTGLSTPSLNIIITATNTYSVSVFALFGHMDLMAM